MQYATDISVIICAHNPRTEYFRRVLDSLRSQTLPRERWELLLIDNASRPSLQTSWDLDWHPHARHVLEIELGIAVARRTGMRCAHAPLILFVDDDNVLDAGYLEEALRIGTQRPELGAWGSGSILPEFEVQPSEYVSEMLPCLALRDARREQWGNVLPFVQITPYGAGLCLRAKVAEAYCRHCDTSAIQIASRRGQQVLLSGEDVEMCYVARDLGLGVGVFPSLKITHLIPGNRVSAEYLLGIFQGSITSNLLLAYKWNGTLPQRRSVARKLLSFCKQMLFLRGIDRRMYVSTLRAQAAAWNLIAHNRGGQLADVHGKES
jgi:glycosyltransferase involved in cell wall biosynthesis